MRSRATSETDHGNITGPWSDLPESFVGVLVTGHPVEESDPLVGRTGAQQSIDQPLRWSPVGWLGPGVTSSDAVQRLRAAEREHIRD